MILSLWEKCARQASRVNKMMIWVPSTRDSGCKGTTFFGNDKISEQEILLHHRKKCKFLHIIYNWDTSSGHQNLHSSILQTVAVCYFSFSFLDKFVQTCMNYVRNMRIYFYSSKQIITFAWWNKIVISSLQLDVSSMNETLKVLKTIHVQQNS